MIWKVLLLTNYPKKVKLIRRFLQCNHATEVQLHSCYDPSN